MIRDWRRRQYQGQDYAGGSACADGGNAAPSRPRPRVNANANDDADTPGTHRTRQLLYGRGHGAVQSRHGDPSHGSEHNIENRYRDCYGNAQYMGSENGSHWPQLNRSTGRDHGHMHFHHHQSHSHGHTQSSNEDLIGRHRFECMDGSIMNALPPNSFVPESPDIVRQRQALNRNRDLAPIPMDNDARLSNLSANCVFSPASSRFDHHPLTLSPQLLSEAPTLPSSRRAFISDRSQRSSDISGAVLPSLEEDTNEHNYHHIPTTASLGIPCTVSGSDRDLNDDDAVQPCTSGSGHSPKPSQTMLHTPEQHSIPETLVLHSKNDRQSVMGDDIEDTNCVSGADHVQENAKPNLVRGSKVSFLKRPKVHRGAREIQKALASKGWTIFFQVFSSSHQCLCAQLHRFLRK